MTKRLERDELITLAKHVDHLTCDLIQDDFEAVTRIVQGFRSAMPLGDIPQAERSNSDGASWDDIAQRLAQFVSTAKAGGRPGQHEAISLWLKADEGEIDLEELWVAAGVANQHDYAGIGSSLTRNMKKAGGPKKWYQVRKENGKRFYKIVPDLLPALQRAFGIRG